MKRLLAILVLMLTLVSASYAQYSEAPAVTPFAFNVHGGYSYLDGVLGADFQYNHWGISGGWMPQYTPYYATPVPSWGIAGTWYSGYYYESSVYLSLGVASAGYVVEDSYYGYYETYPMTILMGGYKWAGNNFYLKCGFGYGWCEYVGSWTGEVTLGYAIFKMK